MTEPQECRDLPAVELPAGDMFNNMWHSQLDFQTTMSASSSLSTCLVDVNKKEAVARIKQNLLALQAECSELLEWLPWKDWKSYPENSPSSKDVQEAQYELIDIQHFVVNIGIHLGMTPELFFDIFMRKQEENRNRQKRGY